MIITALVHLDGQGRIAPLNPKLAKEIVIVLRIFASRRIIHVQCVRQMINVENNGKVSPTVLKEDAMNMNASRIPTAQAMHVIRQPETATVSYQILIVMGMRYISTNRWKMPFECAMETIIVVVSLIYTVRANLIIYRLQMHRHHNLEVVHGIRPNYFKKITSFRNSWTKAGWTSK